jgi:adenosylcobinamide kinase / adenosylcobinamide-phosphate guanylyltransferase
VEGQDHLFFVTGGARSGKSTFAERLAAQQAEPLGGRVLYLATSETNDPEMAERVAAHRSRRPGTWKTVECPLEVPAAVREQAGASRAAGVSVPVFLVDCISFWVSNLLFAGGDLGGTDPGDEFNYDKSLLTPAQEHAASARVGAAVQDLLAALDETGATLVAVSNEVGMGVVPEYPLARVYRDQLGWANQRLAAAADRVYLCVAGFPIDVKSLAVPPFPAKES